MKINRTTLSLIIASLCGTGASALVHGQEFGATSPIASSGRIGDTPSGISSGAPSPSNDPRFGSIRSSSTPVPFAMASAMANPYGQDAVAQPAPPPQAQPMPAAEPAYQFDTQSHFGSSGYAMQEVSHLPASSTWVETEALLWWGKGLTRSPNILRGTSSTVLPSQVISGGEDNPIGKNLFAGMRVNAGTWLDCDQNYGLQGRVFGILTGARTQTFDGSDGNSNGVGVNDTINGPIVYVVNVDLGNLGRNTGTISETTNLDLIGTDISLRTLMIGDVQHRVDLLTGYTFQRLDSGYQLTTSIDDQINGNGILTTQDTVVTKNIFHGGHLGFATDLSSGRFTLNLMGKVALGNMQQTRNINGAFSQSSPPPGTTENRGLFAQPNNIGMIQKDRFTFLPEVGAKIKYQLGRGQLGVGYSLLVMPNVAIAADQLDTTIDFANLGGTMTRPLPNYSTDTFFLHGLDLGYTLQF